MEHQIELSTEDLWEEISGRLREALSDGTYAKWFGDVHELALEGAVIQMVSHGISTGALFILAGLLQERMHTREIAQMGGLWETMPSLSGAGLVFAMAIGPARSGIPRKFTEVPRWPRAVNFSRRERAGRGAP